MAANRVIPTLILVFMLAACTTSTPSRFYVLTPGVAGGEGPPIGNLVVGVGPVRLAAYLERPQLAVRERTNRLNVQEFDRWGGNLEANISWVIAENLSRSLGTESVEKSAEDQTLAVAPLIEEFASRQVASPEQADAGSGQPPSIGLADRIALEDAQPGYDGGDLPEVEIGAGRNTALAADRLPVPQ